MVLMYFPDPLVAQMLPIYIVLDTVLLAVCYGFLWVYTP